MEDHKIIALLWQRTERAIEAMARKFGSRLHQTALNILGCREDAEESVSDTYMAVWNAVPPHKPDPLEGYVYKTGRYIALDRLKYLTAAKRDVRYSVSLDELAGCIPGQALEDTVDARELGRVINAFLGTLKPAYRSLFLRRYWYGDSVQQIARDLELRPNTVTVRLGRMRMQLREYLMKEGYMDE